MKRFKIWIIFSFLLSFVIQSNLQGVVDKRCSAQGEVFGKKAAKLGAGKNRLFIVQDSILHWCDAMTGKHIKQIAIKDMKNIESVMENGKNLEIPLTTEMDGRTVLSLFICQKSGCARNFDNLKKQLVFQSPQAIEKRKEQEQQRVEKFLSELEALKSKKQTYVVKVNYEKYYFWVHFALNNGQEIALTARDSNGFFLQEYKIAKINRSHNPSNMHGIGVIHGKNQLAEQYRFLFYQDNFCIVDKDFKISFVASINIMDKILDQSKAIKSFNSDVGHSYDTKKTCGVYLRKDFELIAEFDASSSQPTITCGKRSS